MRLSILGIVDKLFDCARDLLNALTFLSVPVRIRPHSVYTGLPSEVSKRTKLFANRLFLFGCYDVDAFAHVFVFIAMFGFFGIIHFLIRI